MFFFEKKCTYPRKNSRIALILSNFESRYSRNRLQNIEVWHDFLKTVLPMVILKWISQPSNFTRLLNP